MIHNSNFSNCKALLRGGSIYIKNIGKIKISSNKFLNN